MVVLLVALIAIASGSLLDPLLAKSAAWRQARQAAGASCPPFLTPLPVPAGALDFSSADSVVSASAQVGGVVWGVASFGNVIHSSSAGFSDVPTKQPFTVDTISRIGSVSKVLPTLLAFQAAEAGHWALTDRFAKWQPAFRILRPDGTPGGESLVTVRSLLSQLSGAPRECPLGNLANYTTAEAYAALQGMPLVSEPFARPSYSNLAYSLVGRGLEPMLGASFEALTQKNVFDVVNMTRSGFDYSAEVVAEMATGYSPGGLGSKPGDQLTWTAPAGQAYSTIRDLLRLGSSLLGAPDGLLSATGKKEMLRPLWLNQDGASGFGTPWEMQVIQAAPGVSIVVPTKGGNVASYSSLLAVVPDLNVTLAALWNSGINEAVVGRELLAKVVPLVYEYVAGQQQYVVPPPASIPAKLLGAYATPLVPGFNVTIALDSSGTLSATNSAEGIPTPLSYVNNLADGLWIFRVPYNTPKVLSFDCQAQMEIALSGQNALFRQGQNGWEFSLPGYIPGFVLQHA